MKNQSFALLLEETATFLEMQGQVWEPRAYRRAARSISGLAEDIEDIYNSGSLKALEELDGVGKAIAKKIEEFIKTGQVEEFEKIKSSFPPVILTLLKIPGLGPKKVMRLFKELKIKTINDLLVAAKKHKIANLSGFGERSEQEIVNSVDRVKDLRRPFNEVFPIAKKFSTSLKRISGVVRVEIAGSLRRKKATVKDIDILIATKNKELLIEKIIKSSQVSRVLAKGPTKLTLLLGEIQCDVRIIDEKTFGAALLYFTGSKDHNIAMRRIAISQGKKLSEYGLLDKDGKVLASKTEEEIYKNLGLNFVPPKNREDVRGLK